MLKQTILPCLIAALLAFSSYAAEENKQGFDNQSVSQDNKLIQDQNNQMQILQQTIEQINWIGKWQEALFAKEPVYLISVTRKTKNSEVYYPLLNDDIQLIFDVLSKFFMDKNLEEERISGVYELIYQEILDECNFITGEYQQLLNDPEFYEKTILTDAILYLERKDKQFSEQINVEVKKLMKAIYDIRTTCRTFIDNLKLVEDFEYLIYQKIKNSNRSLSKEDIINCFTEVNVKNYEPAIDRLIEQTVVIQKICDNEVFNVKPDTKGTFRKGRYSTIFTLIKDRKRFFKNTFGQERIYLFDYWNALANEQDKDLKSTVIEKYNFFCKLLTQIESDFQQEARIELVQGLKKNSCLIAFNEMFFSKSVPLSDNEESTRDIVKNVKNFSEDNPQTLLSINFLINTRQEIEKLPALSYTKYAPDFPAELRDKVFMVTSGNCKNKSLSNYWNPMKFGQLLLNLSFMYWNGEIVSTYAKGSYRDEYNRGLENGYKYYFGDGIDHQVPDLMSDYNLISDLIKNCFATEICYDLQIGLRKTLKTNLPNQLIHLFQSNTLRVADSSDSKNRLEEIDALKNLPIGPIIFHVDPDNTEIFKIAELVQEKKHETTEKEPEVELIKQKINGLTEKGKLQFIKDNNTFTITVWKLEQLEKQMK